MSIAISARETEAARIVAVDGEIDVSNAPELRAAIDEALLDAPGALEVDLSGVPYIDSTGIGVLVGAAHRAAEQKISFRVSRPQRNVARVLALLGMGDELGLSE